LGVTPGLSGKTFTVQGYGNVGYWASKFFTAHGAKLVGVAEADGSIFSANGIDPEELNNYKTVKKGISGFPNVEYYTDEQAIYKKA
jgi:glutamate dehydrogenase (NAD(P)+)